MAYVDRGQGRLPEALRPTAVRDDEGQRDHLRPAALAVPAVLVGAAFGLVGGPVGGLVFGAVTFLLTVAVSGPRRRRYAQLASELRAA
jgi:hypothetical protein